MANDRIRLVYVLTQSKDAPDQVGQVAIVDYDKKKKTYNLVSVG